MILDILPQLSLTENVSTTVLTVMLALVAHQIFQRYETYSIAAHAALIFGPPFVLAAHTASRPSSDVTYVSALGSSLFVYLVTILTSVSFHRLSPFHPLARYPGPYANKVTKLRMAFLSVMGKQHEYIKGLHDHYGDIVRIGPNELSVRDPALIPGLLGSGGLRKGPHFFGPLLSSDNLMPMIALQDTDVHLQQRRTWTRGLSSSSIKEYTEQIAVRARQLVSRLEEQRGPVSLDQWINYFAYAFMSDMAFGDGSELLSTADKSDFWVVLDQALTLSSFLRHVPWLGAYFHYFPPAVARARTVAASCRQYAQRRLKDMTARKDLFHYLSHGDIAEKEPPSLKQLVDDALLVMVAGSDSVSSSLTSLFACLVTHPKVFERLQAEVDKFYPPGEDVYLNTQHHRDMPYLAAVINETLRLFPPVPGGTQRQEPSTGGGKFIGAMYIPPGTNVWVHIYSLHRDPRNFYPAPAGFWPERWLIASGETDVHDPTLPPPDQGQENMKPNGAGYAQDIEKVGFVHNEAAFIPFSYGPMNCAGKALALQEIKTVVCAVLQRFRVVPVDGWNLQTYEKEYRDHFVTVRGKVMVNLEVRKTDSQ